MDNGISKRFSDSLEYSEQQIAAAEKNINEIHECIPGYRPMTGEGVSAAINDYSLDAVTSAFNAVNLAQKHYYEDPSIGYKESISKAIFFLLSFCAGGVFANIFFK